MKCKHEYEDPTPNGYSECKLCGLGKYLEPEELDRYQLDVITNLYPNYNPEYIAEGYRNGRQIWNRDEM